MDYSAVPVTLLPMEIINIFKPYYIVEIPKNIAEKIIANYEKIRSKS